MLEYTPLITQGNCVTAAQQTLTLYVGVRIPIPLPEQSTAKSGAFFRSGRGIEDSHHSAARRGGRISRPKVGMLAYQTQGVEIFANGKYPFPSTARAVLFLFLRRNSGLFYLQQAPDIPIYHIALMLSDSPICTFAPRINLRLPLLFRKVVLVSELRKITRPSFYAPSHSSMLFFFFCAVFHHTPKSFVIPII